MSYQLITRVTQSTRCWFVQKSFNDLFDVCENIKGASYADNLQNTLSDTIDIIPDIKNKTEHLLDRLKNGMTQMDYLSILKRHK